VTTLCLRSMDMDVPEASLASSSRVSIRTSRYRRSEHLNPGSVPGIPSIALHPIGREQNIVPGRRQIWHTNRMAASFDHSHWSITLFWYEDIIQPCLATTEVEDYIHSTACTIIGQSQTLNTTIVQSQTPNRALHTQMV
jgi:hypothetical protein